MANETQIGGNGKLFVGEDKILRFELVEAEFDSNGEPVAPSATSIPINMSGWTVVLDVRKSDKAVDPAVFLKTATITGSYGVTRATNTQRALVTLSDDELNTVTNRTYRHSWKRMDAGVETILSYGDFVVEKATAQ